MAPFDPKAQTFLDDPYPVFKELRDRAAVTCTDRPARTYWVLSHERVRQVCTDSTNFAKPGHGRIRAPGAFGACAHMDDGLFFMDKPRHADVRPLMDGILATTMKGFADQVQATANQCLEKAMGANTLEVVSQLAGPLAGQVFMELMGVPRGDRDVLRGWIQATLGAHAIPEDTQDERPRGMAALGGTSSLAMRSYFDGVSCDHTTGVHPCPTPWGTPSLLDQLRDLPRAAGMPGWMSQDEVTHTAVHFALGGFLSTQFLITTGIYHLLRNPGQWQMLKDKPELMSNAVQEMLRFDAPFQMADRWVMNECQMDGVTLQKDSKLVLVYAAANRDEKVFAQPDTFDITRDPNEHLAFGHGEHYCIGDAVAREVAATALRTLMRHAPEARITDQGAWLGDPYFRSLTSLQLRLSP